MDRIKEMLDQIAELDDASLQSFEAEILSEFDTVEKQDPTHETVTQMTGLADALDSLRGEVARRVNERAALESQAAEASARVKGKNPFDSQKEENPPLDPPVPGDAVPPGPVDGAPTEPPMDEVPLPTAPAQDPGNPGDMPPAPGAPDVLDPAGGPPPAPGGPPDPGGPDGDESEDAKKKRLFPKAAGTEGAETTAVEVPAAAEAAVEEVTTTATETPVAAEAAVTEAVVETPAATEAAVETAPEAEAATPAVEGSEAAVNEGEAAGNPDAALAEETDPSATEASTEEETTTTPQEAAVTAAATEQDTPVIEAPADRRPTPKTVSVAITAGADIPNVTAGSSFADMDQVAQAFSQRLHALRRVTAGDGEQHIVASLGFEYPDDRYLKAGDDATNTKKIDGIIAPQAIVASGGFCAPLEQRYDFFELTGTTERPVRDSLAKFQADRGGIRYAASPILKGGGTDYFAASSVWTEDMDKTPGDWIAGTGNLKPCIVVDCPPQIEARTEAVTVCIQFGNLMTRAYPELIKRHNELSMIAHARESEENLLAKIKAAGTAGSSTATFGAARDFFQTLENAAVQLRYRHRMALNSTLRVIAPFWLHNLVRGDLLLQMPGDGPEFTFDLADAKIDGWFNTRNINVTWSLETAGTARTVLEAPQATGAIADIPDVVEWDMFPEGTFLFLDGGTLDLGIIRDSSLVATNDYKTFVETFEGLAKMGPESLHVTSNVEMRGAAQALIDGGAWSAAATP